MAFAPGLPLPVLESGPLERLPPAAAVLAWGETTGIAGARPTPPGEVPPAGEGLAHALWTAPPASPETVARVQHRAFCLEAAESLRLALPGSRMVRSLEEIGEHLHSGGAAESRSGEWVLKAPFSAAGRSRLRGKGRFLEGPPRRRAERLLALHGELLFEPWMERIADFGLCALVLDRECRILGIHRSLLDGGGNFCGIDLLPSGGERFLPGAEALLPGEEALFVATAREIGGRLRVAGYRGPFGLDGWRYRGADGAARFHPLGEINARMTFGLVARGLAERVAGERSGETRQAALRVGAKEELEAARAGGSEVVALLLPGGGDPTAAWLEV